MPTACLDQEIGALKGVRTQLRTPCRKFLATPHVTHWRCMSLKMLLSLKVNYIVL